MGEELKLIRRSNPFALRIVWALKLKGLEYDTVYVDDPAKANQSSVILEMLPVLVHGGKLIAEPLVILEYIDEIWKHNPLLPQDPYDRAKARFWAKFVDEKVSVSIKKVFVKQEEGLEEALENLKHLEEELEGKRFFGGETIGIVDITFGWVANLVSEFEEVSGPVLITEEKFPFLSKWTKEFAAAPIINENWLSREQLLTKFQELHQTSLISSNQAYFSSAEK